MNFRFCILLRAFDHRLVLITVSLAVLVYVTLRALLDAPSHLYKRVCPSVRGSVRPWVLRSFSIKENAD